MYRLKVGDIDNEDETGLLTKDIGYIKNFFFYEDIIYGADDQNIV